MKLFALDLLFPPRCTLCRERLSAGTDGTLCPACAQRVTARYRVTGPVHVADADGAAAALWYEDAVRLAMQRYKFQHAKACAAFFGDETADILMEKLSLWKPDCITYVPLGFARFWKRGYNQSRLLAKRVARRASLPCEKLLGKRPFVQKQSRQGRAQRQTNVQNAFFAVHPAQIAGKRIVVVDDVLTTGATMQVCAAALREAGAEAVFALAATKTGKQTV